MGMETKTGGGASIRCQAGKEYVLSNRLRIETAGAFVRFDIRFYAGSQKAHEILEIHLLGFLLDAEPVDDRENPAKSTG